MKKRIVIITAIIILVAAVVAASVIIALKQQDAPPVDTSIDTTQTEPEKEEMKFYYTSGDSVASTLAALPDKNIDSLLEKLGDDCTVISKELINWNYELCQGYISNQKMQELNEKYYTMSSNPLTVVTYEDYLSSLPCWKYTISVNGEKYFAYATVKTKQELEFKDHLQLKIDENTYNTVFRIAKQDESSESKWIDMIMLYEPKDIVFHAPEFKFICEIVKDK